MQNKTAAKAKGKAKATGKTSAQTKGAAANGGDEKADHDKAMSAQDLKNTAIPDEDRDFFNSFNEILGVPCAAYQVAGWSRLSI